MATRHSLPLLPLLLAMTATAAASTAQRPQPSDYPNFNAYVRALVDYRNQTAATPAPGQADSLCRDADSTGKKKQASCDEQKADTPLDPTQAQAADDSLAEHDDRPAQDSLEAAIDRARSGWTPGYSDNTRSNSRNFPLKPVSSEELENVSLIDLLSGFLPGARGNASPAQTLAQGEAGNDETPQTDLAVTDSLLSGSIAQLPAQAFNEVRDLLFNGIVILDDGYALSWGGSYINPDNSLHLDINSRVRSKVSLVDRDGMPGTSYDQAGALVFDRLNLDIIGLGVDVSAVNGSGLDHGKVVAGINLPNGLVIDLSNTRMGAAGATARSDGGWDIGEPVHFLHFGDNAKITLAKGAKIENVITAPTATTPLVTLNGNLGDISISDISLLDNNDGGSIHIGRYGLTGLNFVDAKIFINGDTVKIDTGTGLTNVGVSIERLALGSADDAHTVGDFYASGIRAVHNTITVQPH